jgi:SAM-dependent methyltransferase
VEGYGPETFGERMADVYDTWYGTRRAEATTTEAVEVLADLAAGGTVLELAIGTGRVALPLAARGLPVHGIDASEAMVAKLRAKPGGNAIPVTIGDFADLAVNGTFDLIFVVFNSLFNLTSQDDQVRCFHNVAQHLSAGGVFVVEAFVPKHADLASDQALRVVDITTDSVTLEVSVHDPVTQTVQYQYIAITQDGVRLYPVPMRYAWPSEMDLMARLAGLELRERWGGWGRSPFTESSSGHVSVYARAQPQAQGGKSGYRRTRRCTE